MERRLNKIIYKYNNLTIFISEILEIIFFFKKAISRNVTIRIGRYPIIVVPDPRIYNFKVPKRFKTLHHSKRRSPFLSEPVFIDRFRIFKFILILKVNNYIFDIIFSAKWRGECSHCSAASWKVETRGRATQGDDCCRIGHSPPGKKFYIFIVFKPFGFYELRSSTFLYAYSSSVSGSVQAWIGIVWPDPDLHPGSADPFPFQPNIKINYTFCRQF
jgi:hypothetical protein